MAQEEIRIPGVSSQLKTELTNIAKNIGVPLASFLKPKLKEISDSFPENMKVKKYD